MSLQRFMHHGEPEGAKFEKRAFRLFLVVSLSLHILLVVSDPSTWLWQRAPVRSEWVMETELVSDWSPQAQAPNLGKKDLAAKQDKAEPDPKPEKKQILPQLPKKFSIKEEEKDVLPEKALAEAPNKPEGEKPTPADKQPEEAFKSKKDEEATEIFKKDLMARLLKEQERSKELLRQEEEKREKQALASKLDKLRQDALQGTASGAIDESHPYIKAVKGYIYQHYNIPEVYNFQEANPPIVLFIVNSRGDLVRNDIYQSSNDLALDRYALQSIQEAALNFPKPPPEIVGRPIQIRFMRRL